VAEVAFRSAAGPVEYCHGLPYHPTYGHTQRPGAVDRAADAAGAFEVRMNGLGFRGPEWTGRRPGVSRLVLLGDSFATARGAPEPETLQARAAARLAGRTGVEWEGFGLGAENWGTAQELLALRDHGRRLRPDVVVLAFFTGNDVVNNAPSFHARSFWGQLDLTRPYLVPGAGEALEARWPHPVRAHLRRWSVLFRWTERRLALRFPPRPSGAFERLSRGELPYLHWEVFVSPPPPAWSEAWRITRALIRAVRDEVRALGARFVVVAVPQTEQVERNATVVGLERWCRLSLGVDVPLGDHLDWNAPSGRLRELAASEGIEFFDLLPVLREETRSRGRTCFTPDWHFTREGYRFVGDRIGEFLAGGGQEPALEREPSPVPALLADEAGLDATAGPPGWQVGHAVAGWRAGAVLLEEGALLVLPAPRPGFRLHAQGVIPADVPPPLELELAVDFQTVGRTRPVAAGPWAFASDGPVTPVPGRHVLVSVKAAWPPGARPGLIHLSRLWFGP